MAEFQVFDSLSKSKKVFKTRDGSRRIKWYTCGPTVYDSAHLGHARTFLTFDIVRRILEYYGYHVLYVMNITDIDDKIIARVKNLPGINFDNYNDKFREFTKKMENEFWNDMDLLSIKRPHVITRVSEYIDKMVKYVEKLENLGFAYLSNGSVYLSLDDYVGRGFDPEPLRKLVEDDGNNPNSSNKFKEDKKNPRDIVLWKKKKPGELFFPSKWGDGRPGWHLECSVMATDILGKEIDIHSGGIDLQFPHHQSEIIQATAYENTPGYKWIKYFLHSGHLNIDGLKMSKSLKNFVTIQEYIENVGSPQELRILFLMHRWDKPLDYVLDTVEEAKWVNKRIQELIDHLEFILKEDKYSTPCNDQDLEFYNLLDQLKSKIDVALRDNFDTKTAMKNILDSISTIYKYLGGDYNRSFVKSYYEFIVNILGMFGLKYAKDGGSNVDVDKFIKLGINLREDVRKIVMENKKGIDKTTMGKLFGVLDDFRDNKLKEAGIVLQDRSGNKTKYVIT